MRIITLIIVIYALSTATSAAQGGYYNGYEINSNNDTIYIRNIAPVYVFKRAIDTRRYWRLIYYVKSTYPIAKHAKRELDQLELDLQNISDPKERRKHTKKLEADLKAQYIPILKKMTFSQGKVLLKLIDRETSYTSYTLIKEFRGGFSAFVWQNVAKIFGANLKSDYDKDVEDRMIEQIIRLYEAGVL